ncbi:hypothetical protein IFVP182_C260257 [Vibrio parahaemolyticus]
MVVKRDLVVQTVPYTTKIASGQNLVSVKALEVKVFIRKNIAIR